ncbi:MAG: DUF1501 domain-containing protein, partial [Planctomycetaceae bacterium]|nr:DUF1501 domain-containing protein [Planctomycetaceae bacterium]
MNRRSFLQLGGLSLGALAGGAASPSLSQLLAAEANGIPADNDFNVILLWANGGPSQLETFDLKPQAPLEYRGEFRPIQTKVPGMEICELLPNLAQMSDRFSLIRSLYHNRNEHSGGTCRFLSGYTPRAANPSDAEYPEIGSVVADHLESQVRDIPLFIANTKFYGGGPAYLGPSVSPFIFRGDPNSKSFSVKNLSVSDTVAQDLVRRNSLLGKFDSFRRE